MSNRLELGTGAPSGLYPWAVEGTLVVGDVVAVSSSAPRTVKRAAAGTANTNPPIGIVTAISNGAAQVALNGEIATGLSGLTRGAVYWLSTTAGQLTASAPGSNKFVVGVAVSATELLVDASQGDLTTGGGSGTVTSFGMSSSDFTVSNSPITSSGDIGLALNTVAIADGGTGQTTKAAAFDALAPTTTNGDLIVSNGTDNIRLPVGTDGQYLQADSAQTTGVKWAGTGAIGTVSSVAVTGTGANGFGVTGSPITTSGSIAITSPNLSVARGGLGTTPGGVGYLPQATGAPGSAFALISPTFKNRIINGAMAIDQRYGGTVAQCTAATNTYTVDRWLVNPTGNAVTAQQIAVSGAGAPNFPYCLQITGAASVTAITVEQRIESYNCVDMGSRSARVSFWANNTTGSSVSINVVTSYALSSDSFTTQTQINSTAVTIATGWAKYTVSIASMSSSSQNGVSVRFAIGALAAANSLSFTGVQFEIGPAVTTFENRPLGMEQSLCYRYYQRFMSNSTYTSLIFGSGTCVSTTNALIWVKHKQAMRASPTLSSSVSANNLIVTDTSDHLVTSFGTSNLGNNSVVIAATTSGLTLGRAVTFGANASAAAYIALSSEL